MNQEIGGSEQPKQTPPIIGEIDPTSLPGNAGYVPPEEFAAQLAAADTSQEDITQARLVATSNGAAHERNTAQRFRLSAWTYGGGGMVFGGLSRAVAHGIHGDYSAKTEAIRTVVEHGGYLTTILGGLVMLTTTTRAAWHYSKANQAQTAYDEAVQSAQHDEY